MARGDGAGFGAAEDFPRRGAEQGRGLLRRIERQKLASGENDSGLAVGKREAGRDGAKVAVGTGREFVAAKLAERDVRHASAGESRYKVEPNVKDGKGGLRDLHTLHWLAKYLHEAEPGAEAVEAGIFTASEYRTFRRCEDFLWTVRCHLHFASSRAEERLTFDVQPVIAEELGYGDRGGLRAVERFMKHYFLVAREVGELTLAVCAALEMKQVKPAPIIGRLLAPLSWRTRRGIRRMTDFRVENGRITVASREVFRQNPVNIIRLFEVAERHAVPFHPEVVRLVRHSLRLIDDKVRQDSEANRIFLDLITARTGVERVLRRMNETGVLGRFLPEFGRIVGMMQFNMYHHYTVDEHLIRSVGLLQRIEEGTLHEDHPLATTIIHQVQGRRALYVAQLLHDIGKREPGDHSVNGARMARTLCPRLGLSKAETDTAAWLIEQHLVMSTFAQSRDLNDPKTIRSFADTVQSPERLRLLLILTVGDIRAVGPGVWNGWKGQLLRALYSETEPVLAGGHSGLGRADRVEAAKEALRQALPGWNATSLEKLIACHHDDYWLSADTVHQAEQAKLMRRAEDASASFAFDVVTNAFTESTELTVLAPNLPRLLAMFAGACAAAGANIMGAHITTTKDDKALDVFILKREHDETDERRAAARIGETMRKLIEGKLSLAKLMEKRRKAPARLSAFHVEPEVVITNTLSDRLTVVEITGRDRPGLLYDLTSALSDLGLDIHSAHIATYGERVVDVFYVTRIEGGKITDETAMAAIRDRLLVVLGVVAARSESASAAPRRQGARE